MKTCTRCGIEKAENEFYKSKNCKDGLYPKCKACKKELDQLNYIKNVDQKKEKARKRYEENKDEILEKNSKRREKNKERYAQITKLWYTNNKSRVLEYNRKWREKNRDQARKTQQNWQKKRLQKNPQLKVGRNVGSMIRNAIKDQKAGRRWEELVGYTLQDLTSHLESQFIPEMNWNNYGTYWHVDHKRPQSWFDQTDPEQFKKCWSLNNLQPLEASKNMSKRNKWEDR
jgi:hypothetical protein